MKRNAIWASTSETLYDKSRDWRVLGIHADTIGRRLKLDKSNFGYEKPGRKEGSGRHLKPEQEQRNKALLTDKTPDELKMPYALWTRESVGELIRDQYGIDLPLRTVGVYLKRRGTTPQKPQKRA